MVLRRAWLVVIGSLLMWVGTGCAPLPALEIRQRITHGVWEGTTKDSVFQGCVKALHLSGYMIVAASKDTGLISTDWSSFTIRMPAVPFVRDAFVAQATYRFNFLVFDSPGNTVTVSLKAVGECSSAAQAEGVNELSRKIDSLFMEFERMIGKPSTIGHYTPSL